MPRKRIAVLTSKVDGVYETPSLTGAFKGFEGSGYDIFVFPGRPLDSPLEGDQDFNEIYGLVDPSRYDGFLLFTSALTNFAPLERFMAFIEPCMGKPMVSVSSRLEGVPSVCIDNESAALEATRHLVWHGARRIGFVTGPRGNDESEARYLGYRRGLAEAGLPFDPALVAEGNWRVRAGREAAATLFSPDRERPDAVFASNDEMARGFLEALQERGIEAPRDYRLIGFDDNAHARYARPRIASVSQSVEEVAERAASILIDLIRGGAAPSISILPSTLVPAASCGCAAKAAGDRGQGAAGKDDPSWFLGRLSVLDSIWRVRGFESRLSAKEGSAAFPDIVARELARLGIPSGAICLYDQAFKRGASARPGSESRQVRMSAAFDSGGNLVIAEALRRFPAPALYPEGLLEGAKPFRCAVMPLFAEDRSYGYAVMEMGKADPVCYEELRALLSRHIRQGELERELEELKDALKDALAVADASSKPASTMRSGRDPITGLADAESFRVLAGARIELCRYEEACLALFLFSLARKQSEAAPRRAARILKQAFREGDLVARLGPGEFAVIAAQASQGFAEEAIRRVERLCAMDDPEFPGEGRLVLNAGSTRLCPGDERDLDELLGDARASYAGPPQFL
jgi:DNA-binding LacI/PurR family transcriptional regulator/GGDEF domain-containing protein